MVCPQAKNPSYAPACAVTTVSNSCVDIVIAIVASLPFICNNDYVLSCVANKEMDGDE